jgi:hypothetical protein
VPLGANFTAVGLMDLLGMVDLPQFDTPDTLGRRSLGEPLSTA